MFLLLLLAIAFHLIAAPFCTMHLVRTHTHRELERERERGRLATWYAITLWYILRFEFATAIVVAYEMVHY